MEASARTRRLDETRLLIKMVRVSQTILGVPVTGVERTIADVVRGGGWTEQVDLAVRQSLGRGVTTLPRLREQLPKSWQARLRAAAVKASP
jgi:hypothetical protein